jgi:hypothetical protein
MRQIWRTMRRIWRNQRNDRLDFELSGGSSGLSAM